VRVRVPWRVWVGVGVGSYSGESELGMLFSGGY
jgi:hypothetical protein